MGKIIAIVAIALAVFGAGFYKFVTREGDKKDGDNQTANSQEEKTEENTETEEKPKEMTPDEFANRLYQSQSREVVATIIKNEESTAHKAVTEIADAKIQDRTELMTEEGLATKGYLADTLRGTLEDQRDSHHELSLASKQYVNQQIEKELNKTKEELRQSTDPLRDIGKSVKSGVEIIKDVKSGVNDAAEILQTIEKSTGLRIRISTEGKEDKDKDDTGPSFSREPSGKTGSVMRGSERYVQNARGDLIKVPRRFNSRHPGSRAHIEFASVEHTLPRNGYNFNMYEEAAHGRVVVRSRREPNIRPIAPNEDGRYRIDPARYYRWRQ